MPRRHFIRSTNVALVITLTGLFSLANRNEENLFLTYKNKQHEKRNFIQTESQWS